MSTIILLRHGATEYNAQGRLQGSLDVPIGDLGRAQAKAAADALVAQYGAPDLLLTSPLARASQTADVLGEAAGVNVVADARLTQRSYGEWEGLTWDEVRSRWPLEYERRMAGLDPRIQGWDASAAVGARVAAALDEACEEHERVVAVSHGSAIMLGTLALLGLDAYSPVLGRLDHGRWNVLRRRATGEWSLERYAIGPEAIGA